MPSPRNVLPPLFVTALIDAAERAAVLGRDAARLDLHFLQVLEHRVLARLAVDQAVGDDAVDGERVLGAARAVDLEAAFDRRPEFTDGAVIAIDWKVRDFGIRSNSSAVTLWAIERAPSVDERRRFRGDLDGLGQRADAQLGAQIECRAPAGR